MGTSLQTLSMSVTSAISDGIRKIINPQILLSSTRVMVLVPELSARGQPNMSIHSTPGTDALQNAQSQSEDSCGSPYTTEIVHLIVGGPLSPAREESETTFHIHESVLVEHSSVFRAMLQHNRAQSNDMDTKMRSSALWREAQTKRVYLPEDRVADWKMMAGWLYANTNSCRKINPHSRFSSHGVVNEIDEEVLLRLITSEQPGLQDRPIEEALRKRMEWRSPQYLGKLKRKTSKADNHNDLQKEEVILSSNVTATTRSSSHGNILLQQSGSFPSEDSDDLKRSCQPTPPTLGSLVRLYILADKYAIGEPKPSPQNITHQGSEPETHSIFGAPKHPQHKLNILKAQITFRLLAICKLARVVPHREDINRLWSNIPISTTKDPLKGAVLKMYARLNRKSFDAMFRLESESEKGDDGSWHEEFLRELLLTREDFAGGKIDKTMRTSVL